MRVTLDEMIKGTSGIITVISGKVELHRYLLALGIAADRVIQVVNNGLDSPLEPVMVSVDGHICRLDREMAAGIRVEVDE